MYPASRSFLFAEGLAHCYEKAKYAEFKVNTKGEAILFDLRGEELQPLNCKQQQSWWKELPEVYKSYKKPVLRAFYYF